MINESNLILDKCSKGHDLTLPHALIYGANYTRLCRVCVVESKRKRSPHAMKPTHGAFDG